MAKHGGGVCEVAPCFGAYARILLALHVHASLVGVGSERLAHRVLAHEATIADRAALVASDGDLAHAFLRPSIVGLEIGHRAEMLLQHAHSPLMQRHAACLAEIVSQARHGPRCRQEWQDLRGRQVWMAHIGRQQVDSSIMVVLRAALVGGRTGWRRSRSLRLRRRRCVRLHQRFQQKQQRSLLGCCGRRRRPWQDLNLMSLA
mmetsp:Transcript_30775/g.71904  ORF Transcript_30775/g.71904 Transcript_30775/m.71904 type:complete len:203 (-) Transcript_30775:1429-2037(-)